MQALRAAHRYIGAQAATGYDLSPAAEWLLDNFHLIGAQLDAVHEVLPDLAATRDQTRHAIERLARRSGRADRNRSARPA